MCEANEEKQAINFYKRRISIIKLSIWAPHKFCSFIMLTVVLVGVRVYCSPSSNSHRAHMIVNVPGCGVETRIPRSHNIVRVLSYVDVCRIFVDSVAIRSVFLPDEHRRNKLSDMAKKSEKYKFYFCIDEENNCLRNKWYTGRRQYLPVQFENTDLSSVRWVGPITELLIATAILIESHMNISIWLTNLNSTFVTAEYCKR